MPGLPAAVSRELQRLVQLLGPHTCKSECAVCDGAWRQPFLLPLSKELPHLGRLQEAQHGAAAAVLTTVVEANMPLVATLEDLSKLVALGIRSTLGDLATPVAVGIGSPLENVS